MKKTLKTQISDAELEILDVLWEAGKPLNANEIRSMLNEKKNWERTTVLTFIRRLLEKEVISQEKREVYYYQPCLKRTDYVAEETRSFVNRLYQGNSKNLAAALVSSEALSKEDIEELRDYFNKNI